MTLRITSTARRLLRLTVRQRWPEIVEPRSSVADAVCGRAEVLTLPFTIRGIARGGAAIEPLYIAATMRGGGKDRGRRRFDLRACAAQPARGRPDA